MVEGNGTEDTTTTYRMLRVRSSWEHLGIFFITRDDFLVE